jgi:hypothetical protein
MRKVFLILLLVLTGGALTIYSASMAETKTPKGDLDRFPRKYRHADRCEQSG